MRKMRVLLDGLLLLGLILSIGQYVSGDCVFGSQSFQTCHFSPWSSWSCFACCSNNQVAVRQRLLCCGNMQAITAGDQHTCYNGCNKVKGVDNIQKKPCSTVCTCTTPTSPTTSLSTSTTSLSTTSSTTPSSSSSTRSGSLICYKAEKDVYKCGPHCQDTNDWDECIRSCSRDMYMTVCNLVSVSLFILGVIVGTLCTCMIKFLCKTRKKHMQRRVSPKSTDPQDRSLSVINEEFGSDDNFPTKIEPW